MVTSHTWKFCRVGGFDQVQLDDGADLLALKDLDQKLWVALACPTRGLEFDERTLDLLDTDGDGRIRANEMLAAIGWMGGLLRAHDALADGRDRVTPGEIEGDSARGKAVRASVSRLLQSLGKTEQDALSLADLADAQTGLYAAPRNGDGVLCPDQVGDPALAALVQEMLDTVGGVADRSGRQGVNRELSQQFLADAAARAAWQGKADAGVLPLGEMTAAAAAAVQAVAIKVDDFFTRCELAAFDPRAAAPLNRAMEDFQALAVQTLDHGNEAMAALPLASVAAARALPLRDGLNPAWQGRMADFLRWAVIPLLGEKTALTSAEWQDLRGRLRLWQEWQAAQPTTTLTKLDPARISAIARGDQVAALDALFTEDLALADEVAAVADVERLLRYRRDLFRLANNFVAFRDFYAPRGRGIFQAGTLYLDGRSCELCVRVENVAAHAAAVGSSGIFLVYCELRCKGSEDTMHVAAAFTAGDSDFLAVGRHGVFYDRKGRDWDATVVRIVDHPISIRQAFWSPYKKLSRTITEQMQKLAASKAGKVQENLDKTVVEGGVAVAAGNAPKAPFDVAKFAGIFAALGLAIGAIGGILTAIVSGMLSLKLWQVPLALAGLLLAISGPSMLLAWFKLKRRTLGPVLDACGWAINARVMINIPFGTSLTDLPRLPAGARRSLSDPYAEKKPVWPYGLAGALLIAVLVWAWYTGVFR